MAHNLGKCGPSLLSLECQMVLPGLEADDDCRSWVLQLLRAIKGVSEAHFIDERLCLHYDPNLVGVEQLQRLARQCGAEILQRYGHELLAICGLPQSANVTHIESSLRSLPGVTFAAVSYATRTVRLEFDTLHTRLESIIQGAQNQGYRLQPQKVTGGHIGNDHSDREPQAGWLSQNRDMALSILCGALGLLAFVGEHRLGFSSATSIGLYIAAYGAGSYDLAGHTVPTILRGKFDVEFLMLVAAFGAAALGQWAEGTVLLFLFSLGHALEGYALDRARRAIEALGSVTPKVARVRRSGAEIEVGVADLEIGDTAIIRPGDRIAVDGEILKGSSAVDQSPITGESVPVDKVAGDSVFAGSLNGDGSLEVVVKKLAKDTTMARVVRMVAEAQTQKSPTQTFTDKFERVLVPAVLVTVGLTATIPPLLGWLPWNVAIGRALSTLVGASPCALALATPAAVLAGIAQAARNGVLIKGGVHLENLGLLSAIAFDKTGTITQGRPEVTEVLLVDDSSEEYLLRLAASVEIRSSHPLAEAVVERAREKDIQLAEAGELRNLQGRGVESEVEGRRLRLGNRKMFDEAGVAIPFDLDERLNRLSESGKPIMIVGVDDQVIGALALADPLRPEAPEALTGLRRAGIKSLIMLTGDNARVAASIAEVAGISEVKADLLPEQKVEAIRELLGKYGMVAMVGDGVNDAPAMAHATVGIAMGAGGTDVALETADVALMGDDLARLPFAVALSRQSRSIIRQNLFLSLAVVGLLIPSTIFGFAGMGVAVFLHEGSTILVVFNALRLLGFKLERA